MSKAVDVAARVKWLTTSTIVSIAATGLIFQLLSVISGPLVARLLGPEGRGQLAVLMVVILICTQIGMGALPAAIAHAVATSGAPARDALRVHLRWWFVAATIPSAASVGCAAMLLRGVENLPVVAGVLFVATFVSIWGIVRNAMLEGEQNVRYLNASRLLGMAFYVVTILIVLLVRPESGIAVILGIYAATLVVSQLVVQRGLRPATGDQALNVERSRIHGFAVRGFISGIRLLDGLGMDLLLVNFLVGQVAVGLYAVAMSVSIVPVIVLTGLATILLPKMAASPEGSIRILRRWVLAAIVIDVFLVAAIELGVGPVVRFAFGSEFDGAVPVARLLAVAFGLLALRRVLTAAAQAQGREVHCSVIEVLSTIVFVLTATILGLEYRSEGVAAGLAIAAGVSCALLSTQVRWRTHVSRSLAPATEVDLVDLVATDDVEQLRT